MKSFLSKFSLRKSAVQYALIILLSIGCALLISTEVKTPLSLSQMIGLSMAIMAPLILIRSFVRAQLAKPREQPPKKLRATPDYEEEADLAKEYYLEKTYLTKILTTIEACQSHSNGFCPWVGDRRSAGEVDLHMVAAAIKNNQIKMLVDPIYTLSDYKIDNLECIPALIDSNGFYLDLRKLIIRPDDVNCHKGLNLGIFFRLLQFVRHYHLTYPDYVFTIDVPHFLLMDPIALDDFTAYSQQTHYPTSALVMAIPLNDATSRDPDIQTNLLRLGRLGYRMLARVEDISMIEAMRPQSLLNSFRYIHFEYSNLSNWVETQPRLRIVSTFSRLIEFPTKTIVGDVYKEEHLHKHIPFSFDYAQGRAFGEPRTIDKLG